MVLEDLRAIHEDNERLEKAISERFLDDPKTIRDRLVRDQQIAEFLERIRQQSLRAKSLYDDADGERLKEIQAISTGDLFEEFDKRLEAVRTHHKRYPGQIAENLERAYKRRAYGENALVSTAIDSTFTGEEGYGRDFDMQTLHSDFVNLPGTKRRPNYVQYLDTFDDFDGFSRADKMKEQYFQYVSALAQYLESFMRKVKPLENLDKLFATFDAEFEQAWEKNTLAGWEAQAANGTKKDGPATQGTGEGIWCQDCEKEFKSSNVYNAHLTGKKHLRAVETSKKLASVAGSNGAGSESTGLARLKEKAIAEREFRVKKLAAAMKTERSDTKVNVERKQTMTDKERAQELEAYNNEEINGIGEGGDDEDDEDARKSNPLNLPLAWDGKPIPYWLWKLHGLGNEFKCEICGDYTYMGRRAFEKHFSEAQHIFGLKRLGITNSSMFREITKRPSHRR